MRRILSLLLGLWAVSAMAINVNNMPVVRLQPNGDTLHCFVSGDEYYHRYHDARGYTLLQHPTTGYWVYADTVVTAPGHWDLVATAWVAGSINPAEAGLVPNLGVDLEHWGALQKRLDVPEDYQPDLPKTSGRNHGTINNVVIFIRFADDQEISTGLSTINAMFNDSLSNSTSMYSYFRKASYNKLSIVTHYYPAPNGNNVISYQDTFPRNYYVPYDATTNPIGYQDDNESRSREFSLLERAVAYVNANSPVSSSLNIDYDNDGYVDNICFVVKGTYTGWSDLLWPHKWSLYDRYVYINNKRVYTFNLQLEGSGSHYFSSSTFCHEMFHTLGAPDLYRYNVGTNVSGFGTWDLMCSNTTPPQHMTAYMKYQYGNWLDSIPIINVPGTYTLHSLADPENVNNCYRVASQDPNQWYVLEYRDNTEQFETALPGKGLIIYRVDTRYSGNASYDGVNTFDEVYLFRPGGSNDSTNGTPAQAYFSGNTNRTSFTPNTNPFPWLTQNIIDTTFAITDITSPGTTISFNYVDLRGCRVPTDLAASNITGVSAHLGWEGNSNSYRVRYHALGENTTHEVVVNAQSFTLSGLALNTLYEWQVRALCSASDSSAWSSWASFRTDHCAIPVIDTLAEGDETTYNLPINTYYNYTYSQMIYPASELGGEQTISKIAFLYTHSSPLTSKTNCTIYMGHTSLSSFAGANVSSLVPFSSLQPVYTGSMNCSQGWLELTLDSVFEYNGTSNLVIAIDDNSGAYNNSFYKFSCTSTQGYPSITCYSDSWNFNPATDTYYSGSISRKQMRPDIIFFGCPAVQNTYTVTLNVADYSMGSVVGAGAYPEGTMVSAVANPAAHHHFVAWVTPSGDSILENPYNFVLNNDVTLTALFDIDRFHVSVHADASMGSAYFVMVDDSTASPLTEAWLDYGTQVRFLATPTEHYHFRVWLNDAGDSIPYHPYSPLVSSDLQLTALFAIDRHHFAVLPNDPALGEACFMLEDDPTATNLTEGEFDYGTVLLLSATPSQENPVNLFVNWSDGNPMNPRRYALTDDVTLTAVFSHTDTTGIDRADAAIQITTGIGYIEVCGAEGRDVRLFDMMGRQLALLQGSDPLRFNVAHSGSYIVKVEGCHAQKVVVSF